MVKKDLLYSASKPETGLNSPSIKSNKDGLI